MPALATSITANDQGLLAVTVARGKARYQVEERPDGTILLTPQAEAPEAAPAKPAETPSAQPASHRATLVAPTPANARDSSSTAAKPAPAPGASASPADAWLQLNREAMQMLRGRAPAKA